MTTFQRRGSLAAIAFACATLAGCATYDHMAAAPVQSQPIAIEFSHDQLGMNDMPLGAYRVPDSEVIVSGHQAAGVGMAFGLIGVLVSDAIDRHRGANAIESSSKLLTLKLDDEARADIQAVLANDPLKQKFTLAKGPATRLTILPAVIVTFVDGTRARPYVELKVELLDAGGKSLWATRYFASTGVERALQGPGSWGENDGEAFKASVSASLAQAVKVMLNDVAAPYARDEKKMQLVQASVPYMKPRFQMLGLGLVEDDKYVAFVPKVGDVLVMSGVNVLDKTVTVYRTATADDKFMVLPEGAPVPAPAAAAASAPAAAASATVAALAASAPALK
ncbi:MAG: hypothetical protein ACJ8IK_06860 [Burkholderiaceae bacterium]